MSAVTPFGTRTGKLVHGTHDSIGVGTTRKPVRTLCGKRATPSYQYGPGQWDTTFVQGVHTGHEGGTCNACVKAYGMAPADVPGDLTAPDGALVAFHKRDQDPHLLYARCTASDDGDTWGHWSTGYASPELVAQWTERHVVTHHTPPTFDVCSNCAEPIRGLAVLHDGKLIRMWDHHTREHHTVCDWREGMAPTGRVATPAVTSAYAERLTRAALEGDSIPAHDETLDLAESIGKQLDAFHAYVSQVRTPAQADAAVAELLAAAKS